jgi:hypothetical protein
MGDAVCDDCGEQPYVAPVTRDYEEYHDFNGVPDIEIWCECTTDIPVVFDDTDTFDNEKPDQWGQEGGRFVCYECGAIPFMRTSTKGGGKHPKARYHLSCRCEHRRVGFSLRATMPDKWKKDMDPTKWPNMHEDIHEAVADHGPITLEQLAEEIGLDDAGVQCLTLHMRRENKLFKHAENGYMTFEQVMDGPYDMDENHRITNEYSDPDETGLRSGKGTGFFSRLLGLGGDD